MNDQEFNNLQNFIHTKMLELEELQKAHIKETGRRYVINGPLPVFYKHNEEKKIMDCTKISIARVEHRGIREGKCQICGEQIMILATGRSIWIDGTSGGFGEVRKVGEVYCPKCDDKPKLPPYGTPIYESQIIEVVTK